MSENHPDVLFRPLSLRSLTLPNRLVMSPMCQYSAVDGLVNDWHLTHYATRALGGVGLVLVEASAVRPEGRISAGDLGLWDDRQIPGLKRLVDVVHGHGVKIGIQLAHAGRKASVAAPWTGGAPVGPEAGGWVTVAPSPLAFAEGYSSPRSLDLDELPVLVADFAAAAGRALKAGFDLVEIHGAHGYLLHQFLSPLTNQRTDQYGGSFENRSRLFRDIARAVRQVWPDERPVFARLSATDWVEGGWDLESSVTLSRLLKDDGVDLIDVSSGGLVPQQKIPLGPGYQVPLANGVRRGAGLPTSAVGLITQADQAREILSLEQADLVLLGRVLLRDPYWARHAWQSGPGAKEPMRPGLPAQYLRGF